MKASFDLEARDRSDLLDRCRPRKSETKEHDEEEGPPKIPIPQRPPRILSIRIRSNHQLQIAYDPRQISLHRVPDGLGQSVGRRPQRASGDAYPGAPTWRGGGGSGHRGHDRGRGGRGPHLLVGRQGEGRMGDGDGSARGARGAGGEDGGSVGAGVDEVLYLVDVGLGGGMKRHRIPIRHLRSPRRRTAGSEEGRGLRTREEEGRVVCCTCSFSLF